MKPKEREKVFKKAKAILQKNWHDIGGGLGYTRPATKFNPFKGIGLLGKFFVLLVALTIVFFLATIPSVLAQEPLVNMPSINSQNVTDLIIAGQEGNVLVVKGMLKRGFDINAKTYDV